MVVSGVSSVARGGGGTGSDSTGTAGVFVCASSAGRSSSLSAPAGQSEGLDEGALVWDRPSSAWRLPPALQIYSNSSSQPTQPGICRIFRIDATMVFSQPAQGALVSTVAEED